MRQVVETKRMEIHGGHIQEVPWSLTPYMLFYPNDLLGEMKVAVLMKNNDNDRKFNKMNCRFVLKVELPNLVIIWESHEEMRDCKMLYDEQILPGTTEWMSANKQGKRASL